MIIDWISANVENIVKVISVIATAGVTLYQIKKNLPGSRSRLKLDLEILQLLPKEDDPSYKLLKDRIDARISRLYSGAASGDAAEESSWEQGRGWAKRIKWGHFLYGSGLLIIFGAWTYSLYHRGSWWAILTGFVAFGGVGNLMLAFDKRSNRTSSSDQNSAPEQQTTTEEEQ